MAGLWQRHPRYMLLIAVTLVTTFYLLVTANMPPRAFYIQDTTLQSRLARSKTIYSKVPRDRKDLIKKFGPQPEDVNMFPPNVAPWPPYTVWDFFPAAFNCPHDVERLGALGDGGKWVCGISRVAEKPDCVVYSFGINGESSFEAEILANTNHCRIWGYDFSVKSFGPEISILRSYRTHFKAVGLAGSDKPHGDPPMFTLETLMRGNGHTHIDILKIDIESWEFETITALLTPYIASGKPLPFGQLQLEIHLWNKTFHEYLAWWETLEAAGLRPFWTEPNLVYQNYNKNTTADLAEYSFLNIKGDNIFIQDPKGPQEEPRHRYGKH